jgi:MraZ protein
VLLGEFEQRLDEKNRLTIPARLRDAFADGVFLARGFDGCLTAYSRDGWGRLVASQTARLDLLSREGRQLERFLFGGAVELELDRQGRVPVPAPLLRHAGLERDIVIAGVNDRLEIWNREAWERAFQEFAEGSIEHVAERVARESR